MLYLWIYRSLGFQTVLSFQLIPYFSLFVLFAQTSLSKLFEVFLFNFIFILFSSSISLLFVAGCSHTTLNLNRVCIFIFIGYLQKVVQPSPSESYALGLQDHQVPNVLSEFSVLSFSFFGKCSPLLLVRIIWFHLLFLFINFKLLCACSFVDFFQHLIIFSVHWGQDSISGTSLV